MAKTQRLALALAFALAIALGGSHALAFSYTDGLAGLGGSEFADPDARFDAMSDQMSQMYGERVIDYSDQLSGEDAAPANAGAAATPRLPTNIGSTH